MIFGAPVEADAFAGGDVPLQAQMEAAILPYLGRKVRIDVFRDRFEPEATYAGIAWRSQGAATLNNRPLPRVDDLGHVVVRLADDGANGCVSLHGTLWGASGTRVWCGFEAALYANAPMGELLTIRAVSLVDEYAFFERYVRPWKSGDRREAEVPLRSVSTRRGSPPRRPAHSILTAIQDAFGKAACAEVTLVATPYEYPSVWEAERG